MAYSTIEKKRCKCGCGKYPALGYGGYSYSCAPEEIKEKVGSRRDMIRKNKNTRNAIKVKLRAEIREKDRLEGKDDLEAWFLLQMHSNEKICDNCGISLAHLNEWAWRGSQHHCLEKSLFPSVATNPINHLVLGYYCCHQQFHTSMLNASKMPVFQKAKEIVEILYPLLTDREQGRISEYYGLNNL